MIFVHKVHLSAPAKKEIRSWPDETKKDLGALLMLLQRGEVLGRQDSSPMKTVARGCFEIRLRGADERN